MLCDARGLERSESEAQGAMKNIISTDKYARGVEFRVWSSCPWSPPTPVAEAKLATGARVTHTRASVVRALPHPRHIASYTAHETYMCRFVKRARACQGWLCRARRATTPRASQEVPRALA